MEEKSELENQRVTELTRSSDTMLRKKFPGEKKIFSEINFCTHQKMKRLK